MFGCELFQKDKGQLCSQDKKPTDPLTLSRISLFLSLALTEDCDDEAGLPSSNIITDCF